MSDFIVHKNAVECYEKSYTFCGESAFNLGSIYYHGGPDGKKSDYKKAYELFKYAAEHFHYTDAKKHMGDLYFWGKVISSDNPDTYKLARKWYKEAADSGNKDAQYMYAWLNQFGLGGDVNLNDALRYYEASSQQGKWQSHAHAADIYFHRKDYPKAMDHYIKSVAQNDIRSHRKLADLYILGLGTGEVDYDKAVAYYNLAQKQGDELAKISLELHSLLIKGGGSYTLSAKDVDSILAKVDEAGNDDARNQHAKTMESYRRFKGKLTKAAFYSVEAAYILALKYYTGDTEAFEQNHQEAYRYAKFASDKGYAPAHAIVANLYYRGLAVPQSYENAFQYYAMAVEGGYIPACDMAGFLCRTGMGKIKQDFERAIYYYRKGIDAGLESAAVALGEVYEFYTKDLREAIKWYKKAADYSAYAAYRLGCIYYYGPDSSGSRYTEALKYYTKAAAKGHTESIKMIGEIHLWHLASSSDTVDFLKAKEWYEKAAEKGNSAAQYVLGYLHMNGLIGEADDKTALRYLTQAAAQGAWLAKMHSGDIYKRLGLYHLAFDMLKAAADEGNVHSQQEVADLYALGLGCSGSDLGSALDYYELARDAGDKYSEILLNVDKCYPPDYHGLEFK